MIIVNIEDNICEVYNESWISLFTYRNITDFVHISKINSICFKCDNRDVVIKYNILMI